MNQKMKMSIWIGLALLAISLLSGCGSGSNAQVEGKVNVVTSFYPLYYLASEIGGEDAHVVNLIAAGVEPHEWTPKSRDLDSVTKAQLFLYNGAGLEGWVDNFLQGLGSDSQVMTVEVSRGIKLISGEHNHEHEHEHEGENEHADGHEEHDEHDEHEEHEEHADHDEEFSDLNVDPHTWVSPRSALIMAANIRDAYMEADPEHQAGYESRYDDLAERLMQLDEKYTETLAPFKQRDIVVSHQAFGYLCRDYNLNQISIMGLSPDAEPRAQDLLEIARYVKEHQIPYIFFEELVSEQLADTLAREAKVETLVLNPLEGLTVEQEKAGENYFTLSERNLENLQKALR